MPHNFQQIFNQFPQRLINAISTGNFYCSVFFKFHNNSDIQNLKNLDLGKRSENYKYIKLFSSRFSTEFLAFDSLYMQIFTPHSVCREEVHEKRSQLQKVCKLQRTHNGLIDFSDPKRYNFIWKIIARCSSGTSSNISQTFFFT